MPARVIDASVIAAWCFQEPRSEEAEAIIKGSEILAPSLLNFELANIARNKILAYPKNILEISKALIDALATPIQWSEVSYPDVLRLAVDNSLTAYDASYLYLSIKFQAPLATFDDVLFKTALKYSRHWLP